MPSSRMPGSQGGQHRSQQYSLLGTTCLTIIALLVRTLWEGTFVDSHKSREQVRYFLAFYYLYFKLTSDLNSWNHCCRLWEWRNIPCQATVFLWDEPGTINWLGVTSVKFRSQLALASMVADASGAYIYFCCFFLGVQRSSRLYEMYFSLFLS